MWLSFLNEREAPVAVASTKPLFLAHCPYFFPGVLAHGPQQAIAHPFPLCVGDHERLTRQLREQIEDLADLERRVGADCLRRLQRPTSREYREAPQQHSLLVGQ